MRILVVTGTGTGVGKTIVAAALAACALHNGERVAVVKPVQTGVAPGEPGDLAEVHRLTGLTDLHEYVRFTEPLAPATAARRLGEAGPKLSELADRIRELDDRDLVIIEGAGGAAVRFNTQDETFIDLISYLEHKHDLEILLTASAGLGALNAAALTAAAVEPWGMGIRHLVIGDWPAEPGLAERCNLTDLRYYGNAIVRGVIPHGAGELDQKQFRELALSSLTATLGGTFDAPHFIQQNSAPLPSSKGRL